ncbi:hypothetical protein [Rhizobium croatiense]|uniref:Uncharacterized protein n=1 Tax=Rhizobium croatiense TaxID=2867516 RepID=A0ABS7LU26_9HYPH|nr:hypothetical protein [Rhizobium croatiense]MBY4628339.1 hypothetical protein [Rhizobium croatiense]
MKSRQFRLPLRHGRPIEADDTVEADMPAAFPSRLSTTRLRPTGAVKRGTAAKKIKNSSQTLLRFCRDPHRSRPPTRQADPASLAMGD